MNRKYFHRSDEQSVVVRLLCFHLYIRSKCRIILNSKPTIEMKIGIFVVLFLIFSVLEYVDTAFQCYQCSDCGSNWDPNRARVVLTEAGSNVCVVSICSINIM